MKKILVSGLFGLFVATSAQAGDLEAYLSAKSINAQYAMDVGEMGYGGGQFIFGGYYNTESDLQGNIGLMVTGTPTSGKPFSYGLGLMGYLTKVDEPSSNVQAATLGGLFKYHIPSSTPMAVGARLFYAPEVVTFGDGENFMDFWLDYEVEVIPAAAAFVGYRKTRTKIKDFGNYDLEDRFHVGIRMTF